jgi:hypothetical protein
MLIDACSDLGMRKLHQQSAAAAQHQHVLAVHAPRYRPLGI